MIAVPKGIQNPAYKFDQTLYDVVEAASFLFLFILSIKKEQGCPALFLCFHFVVFTSRGITTLPSWRLSRVTVTLPSAPTVLM